MKVAVRVRPFNSREKERNSKCCMTMEGKKTSIKNIMEGPNAEEKAVSLVKSSTLQHNYQFKRDGNI